MKEHDTIENSVHVVEDCDLVSIELIGKYKSLRDLGWADVPPFVVLTGENGTGKTHLLQCIAGVPDESNVVPRVEFSRHSENGTATQYAIPANKVVFVPSSFQDLAAGSAGMENLGSATTILIKRRHTDLGFGNASVTEDMQIPQPFLESIGISGSEHPLSYGALSKLLANRPGLIVPLVNPLGGLAIACRAFQVEVIKRATGRDIRISEAHESLGQAPWEIMNGALEEAGLEIRMIGPDIDRPYEVRFDVNGEELGPQQLSTGERTMVGLVSALFSAERGGVLPELLLLDEPDAYLHPSLTDRLMRVLENVFVGRHGIRVILTTHSPSTVALAPPSSLFVIHKFDGGHRIGPSPKWPAVSALTKGVITLGPNTKTVFVEDQSDVEFFSAVKDVLESREVSEQYRLTPGTLAFIPASRNDVTGGKDKVERWVADIDAGHIHGIVDSDGRGAHDGTDGTRLHRAIRYEMENYLFDPILLAVAVTRFEAGSSLAFEGLEGGKTAFARKLEAKELQAIVDSICHLLGAKLLEAGEIQDDDTRTVDVELITEQKLRYPAWFFELKMSHHIPSMRKAISNVLTRSILLDALRDSKIVPKELAQMLKSISTA